MRETLVAVEDQGRALTLGECLDGAPHPHGPLAGLGRIGHGLGTRLGRVVAERPGRLPRPPLVVQAQIHHNAVEPRGELRVGTVSLRRPVHPNERLLGHVLRQVPPPERPEGQGERLVLVSAHQLPESVHLVTSDRGHQVGVGRGIAAHVARSWPGKTSADPDHSTLPAHRPEPPQVTHQTQEPAGPAANHRSAPCMRERPAERPGSRLCCRESAIPSAGRGHRLRSKGGRGNRVATHRAWDHTCSTQ